MRSRCSTTTSWTGSAPRAGGTSPRTVRSPCCTGGGSARRRRLVRHERRDPRRRPRLRLGRPAVRLRAAADARASTRRRRSTRFVPRSWPGSTSTCASSADAAADEADARRVALLKSGRYTVTRPLEMGRRLAGVDDRPGVAPLAAYGDAVGIAFQLRDDVLGLFGDPGRTGKERRRRSARRQAHAARPAGVAAGPDRPPAASSRPPSATRRSPPVTRNGVARSWRRAAPFASIETLLGRRSTNPLDALRRYPNRPVSRRGTGGARDPARD